MNAEDDIYDDITRFKIGFYIKYIKFTLTKDLYTSILFFNVNILQKSNLKSCLKMLTPGLQKYF